MGLRLFLALSAVLATAQLAAESIAIPVTKDNSIVLVDGEWTENGGQKGQIRIKGNQHIVAMGFDTSTISGRRVKRATLACFQSDQTISGVTLSTIAAPWDETKSNGLTAGITETDGWGYAGARFPAVMGGNAFTLVQHVPSDLRDGMYRWDVSPDMVHALAIGIAHGLAIHEHDADVTRNPTIFAREQSARKPILFVELDDQPDPDPLPPSELKLSAISGTFAKLTLKAPAEGFAYDVMVDGVSLGRHNIPLVAAGATQTIPIRDLPADVMRPGTHEVQVVTLSRTGKRSAAATTKGELFESAPIANPTISLRPAVSPQITDVAVIPITDKYDQAGKPVGDLPADYRTHNVVFDGGQVQLNGAAGEVVGFQLLLRGRGDVSIQVTLDGPPVRVDLHQAVYVPANGRMIPDPLVPLPKTLALQPDVDQVVFADIYFPFDSPSGVRRGTIAISDGRVALHKKCARRSITRSSFPRRRESSKNCDNLRGMNNVGTGFLDSRLRGNDGKNGGQELTAISCAKPGRVIPLEVTVLPFAIPKRATFLCEMNGYGVPDHVHDYYAIQQIAYDHRVHANILHYSHLTAAPGARKSNTDMRLRSGRRMDNKRYDDIAPGARGAFWDDFAEAFGPYLDGSLFKEGHRGPIPAPGFYLTFHESWPLNVRSYFSGDLDAYRAFRDQPIGQINGSWNLFTSEPFATSRLGKSTVPGQINGSWNLFTSQRFLEPFHLR